MPSPKKSNKKSIEDKAQKSLFSFVDDKKGEKIEPAKVTTKEEIKEKKTAEKPEPIKEKNIEKFSPEEKLVSGEIPKNLFYKENKEPFGLKLGNVKLDKVLREGVTSTYIRYLIATGKIVDNLDQGLLLDVDYDGGQNKAYCKFYDLDEDDIKIWIDTTDHEPYCLSKEPISELEKTKLTEYPWFKRFEEIKKFDLLSDKEIKITKLYGETPTNIGGTGTNIRTILEENGKKAYEADIRYHLNYIFDRQLIPGLIYCIKNGKLEKIDFEKIDKDSKKVANELRDLFKDESPEIQEFSEAFLDIFITPIPDVKRMAMDIEVSMDVKDHGIPDPRLAKQEVISISFVATDGLKLVYILEREGYKYTKPHEKFPPDAKVIFFKSEKSLLIETFRLMWEYPVVITFNGDNFDLNYLYHRANDRLKVNKDLNPIQVKRGFGIMTKAECELRSGIHIDVFNLFFNRSISGYAFGGAYESSSLNAISAALLGEEKYQHEEEIQDMDYNILSWYNLKDSLLTLELTKFNNSLVWNLIILLCRITKMPVHEMVRRQISTWIRNIFHFEHRRKNYLIPRRSEISELKKGGKMMSSANDKKFQGAYVIKPVPGIHFDVVVMDFASLYPSIIKEYNLSYETVICPHKEDRDNLVKGSPYHICSQKMGIFAYVVGFFRDIRVKYFKPKSEDKSSTEKQRSYNQTIQQALKVFVNASFGVFGSQNFPLFCLPVAESITGIGQYSIKQTIKKTEEIGIKVLYGDTDSVFLLNPSKEQLSEITDWSKKTLDLDLEEEKTYQFLALSDRKKNYLGVYKDTKYIDMKGLVAKKKNTPEFIKKAFSDLLEIIKEVTSYDEFLKAKKDIKKLIISNFKKIGKPNTFNLKDYAINIIMQKKLDNYKKTIPQHVRAAQEFKKKTAKEYQKGETISFIKSKDKIGAKVIELANLQDIDVKKYKELLRSALEQFVDAFSIGIDISSLETLEFQKLDGFI